VVFEDALTCIPNEYTNAIHFTPSFAFQNYVYERLTEPDTYTVTGDYEINTNSTYYNSGHEFEAGMAWYNYEFSKSSPTHIFAVL